MEDEALTLANGFDALDNPTSGDVPAPNGFSSEKSQTLTLNQTQEEEEEEGNEGVGSDGSIKLLDQEIQKLKRERLELQSKLDDTLAEMERSEAEKKAIASHASYLEGALLHAQEALQDLELERGSILDSKTALEDRIRELEVYLADEREKAAAMDSKKDGEIFALELKAKALEEHLLLLKEEKEAAEEEVKRRVSWEKEMENATREMESNSELEGKIDQHGKEAEAATADGLKVSWAVAGAAVTSTAAVAVAVTVIYLRNARQW